MIGRFDLQQDTVTESLRSKLAQIQDTTIIMEAGAKATQVEISHKLKANQTKPHAYGWPATRFFYGGPDSVEKRVGVTRLTPSAFEVQIADLRFSHRIYGGTVTPKRRKYLAAPLSAEARDASQGRGSIRESVPGLKYRIGEYDTPWGKRFGPHLARKDGPGLYHPVFALMRQATHQPHPDELPDPKKVASAARRGMIRAATLLLKAQGGQP